MKGRSKIDRNRRRARRIFDGLKKQSPRLLAAWLAAGESTAKDIEALQLGRQIFGERPLSPTQLADYLGRK